MAIIEIKDFTYTYPATEEPALKNINLEVQEGEFVALVGPNGAGKTTLCYAIAGFIPHFFQGEMKGSIKIKNKSLQESTLNEWVINVGLVFQNPFNQISAAKFSVYEEIAFGLENIGIPQDEMRERIDKIMELTHITELKDRSPYALSGGQQQRVALASILVMEPDVLVLDEPTSQLDPIGTREVFSVIKEMSNRGMTVIMAEHKIEWVAEFSDRVLALADGEAFLEGDPITVLTSDELPKHNCSITRYTATARQAVTKGLLPSKQTLPITLNDAIEAFSNGVSKNEN